MRPTLPYSDVATRAHGEDPAPICLVGWEVVLAALQLGPARAVTRQGGQGREHQLSGLAVLALQLLSRCAAACLLGLAIAGARTLATSKFVHKMLE